ncbi:MAG: clostripain-related cysteine peptidase [Promethearchaeota archaeon]
MKKYNLHKIIGFVLLISFLINGFGIYLISNNISVISGDTNEKTKKVNIKDDYVNEDVLTNDSVYDVSEDILTNNSAYGVNTDTLTNDKTDDWTFLVYLAADNDLNDASVDDFLEMASVGSDSNVKIVVQYDREYSSSIGWRTTKRFYITEGMEPTSENALEDLGELNMADSTTLSDFITWGITNYPSSKYALILWDHGHGWFGACIEDHILLPNQWKDMLNMSELLTALSTSYDDTGIKLDLIGFDACYMGMAEVDYQIQNYADIRVGSEQYIPEGGWPYNFILSDLKETPTMNATNLGNTIVTKYIDFVLDPHKKKTMSAIDLTKENTLSLAIETFSNRLISGVNTYQTEIASAKAASYKFYDEPYIDLYDFAKEIYNQISDKYIQTAAQGVMDAISTIVTAEGIEKNVIFDAYGISIYFPETFTDYDSAYKTALYFTADLSWDEFLYIYFTREDTYEENDNYLSAYDLTLYEQTWLSSIDGQGIQADEDWYEIHIDSNFERLIVVLQFIHAYGDIDINVYTWEDNSFNLIIKSWSTTDNEYIDFVVPSSGTYYLRVYRGNAGNGYDLWWDDLSISSVDDAYEENDGDTSAYDLSSYKQIWLSSIEGLGIQSDEDWYEVYIDPGYEYLVVVLQFNDLDGNIDLDVYNSGGFLIKSSTSMTDNEYINYDLPSSGTYYLRIYGEDAGNIYDLWWDVLIGDDAYEQNDGYTSAYDLSYYEQIWLDDINGPGVQADNDWYEISITPTCERLLVELQFIHAEGNIELEVWDTNLYFIAASYSTTDNEYIDFVVPSSGTYYLRVFYGNERNTYNLWWDDIYNGGDIPTLQYYSHTVDDDTNGGSSGDGDGIAEPGEAIELLIVLENIGTGGATNAIATLSTGDPLITIVNPTEFYPQIDPGSTAGCYNDYIFNVDPNHASGYYTFTLDVTSNDLSWTDTFDVQIGGPTLQYYFHKVDDDSSGGSSGDGDGTAEAGETIELVITLENIGSESATNIVAILSTDDPLLTITDDFEKFPDIEPGLMGICFDDFDFYIDESHVSGYTTFTLEIISNEGSWTNTFKEYIFIGSGIDDEYEENDDYKSAYDISLYERTWLRDIEGLGIQLNDDWYEIFVDPGEERLIVLLQFTHADGNIDLAVYDSDGVNIITSSSKKDKEAIDYILPSSGTYYILVYNANAGNNYDLWWDDVSYGDFMPTLQYCSHKVDDDSNGDSSGDDDIITEAGETIELLIILENIGSVSATNIVAILSTDDPLLTITDDFKKYHDIDPGLTGICIDDFAFYIDKSHVSGYTALTLEIISNEGSWEDTFEIYIEGIDDGTVVDDGDDDSDNDKEGFKNDTSRLVVIGIISATSIIGVVFLISAILITKRLKR